MSIEARLRISLSTGEFEVEGSAEFVAKYDEIARQLLSRIQESAPGSLKSPGKTGSPAAAQANGQDADGNLPEFGEAVHRLPKNATGTDQILVAGYYAAMANSQQTFVTAEASKLLVEQSIKLANPSQSLKNNLNSKKVFKVGNRYKLSRDGIDRVNELLQLA